MNERTKVFIESSLLPIFLPHLVVEATYVQFPVTGLQTDEERLCVCKRERQSMEGEKGVGIAFQGIYDEVPHAVPSPSTLSPHLPQP